MSVYGVTICICISIVILIVICTIVHCSVSLGGISEVVNIADLLVARLRY